jgi:prophage regulatory protein
LDKSFYSLDAAAAILHCKPSDLIHLAGNEEVALLIGVPDGIRFRTYDASADLTEKPALLEPQLLELTITQCQKIELNGGTEQSDFRVGYLIAPNGALQRLMPSYGGRLRLNHGWAFWRTYRGPYIKEIELIPERLFVIGDDVRKLHEAKAVASAKANKPRKQIEPAKTPIGKTNINVREKGGDALVISPVADERQDAVEEQSTVVRAKVGAPNEPMLVILRIPEVCKRTGLSRSTVYDKQNPKSERYDSTFPKKIRLSEKTVGWSEQEISEWLVARRTVSVTTSS